MRFACGANNPPYAMKPQRMGHPAVGLTSDFSEFLGDSLIGADFILVGWGWCGGGLCVRADLRRRGARGRSSLCRCRVVRWVRV
jgi:hypothetical protein